MSVIVNCKGTHRELKFAAVTIRQDIDTLKSILGYISIM